MDGWIVATRIEIEVGSGEGSARGPFVLIPFLSTLPHVPRPPLSLSAPLPPFPTRVLVVAPGAISGFIRLKKAWEVNTSDDFIPEDLYCPFMLHTPEGLEQRGQRVGRGVRRSMELRRPPVSPASA